MFAFEISLVRARSSAKLPAIALIMICAICAGYSAGCRKESAVSTAEASEVSTEDAVAKLKSLGYVDFADSSGTNVDDGPDGAVMLDPECRYPGFNLYNDRTACTAHLIDANGNIINDWHDAPCGHWAATGLLPNGDLVVVGRAADNPEGFDENSFVIRFSWEGEVLWRKKLTAHHDINADGNELLTLTFEQRRERDVNPDVDIRDNFIVRLDKDGNVLARHSLYRIFQQSAPDKMRVAVRPYDMNGAPALDIFHANSVVPLDAPALRGKHPMFAPGNVLVSMRHQDLLAAINLESETVVWTWGRGELSGQHDASVLENGHILVFDNGLAREASRAIEIDPNTGKIVWEYSAADTKSFFTVAGGNAQRLANGNSLLVNYDKGYAVEVAPSGRPVWEFRNPYRGPEGNRGVIGKMRRYDSPYVTRILDSRTTRRVARSAADPAGRLTADPSSGSTP